MVFGFDFDCTHTHRDTMNPRARLTKTALVVDVDDDTVVGVCGHGVDCGKPLSTGGLEDNGGTGNTVPHRFCNVFTERQWRR